MSYKTPLKPVTHGVLKRYDFLDKAQNEAVNERDNRKIYVGKVSMSPFLYFCFLLQIPVCVSIFFSSKIFRDSGISYVFFWHLRGKLALDWPKFDPLAHAFRLTAVVIEGLFASITISVKHTPKCMQMVAIYSNSRLQFLSLAKGGKIHTNSSWQAAKQRHAQRYTDIHSLTKINNS